MSRGFAELVAWANTSGVGAAVVRAARNLTLTDSGVGLYDYTLGEALNANEMLPQVSILTTQDVSCFLTNTSDTVKRLSTRDSTPTTVAAAAKDADHYIAFWHVAFGNF